MKAIRKSIAIVCIMATLLAVCSFGAMADDAGGSGWAEGTVTYNGYKYDYNLYITANNSQYTSFANTQANIKRYHGDLHCQWLTVNDGYQSASGGSATRGPMIGLSSSNPVTCPIGQVGAYTRASTQITFYADRTGTYTLVW